MPSVRRLLFSRAWLFAIAFGEFAYLLHKLGVRMGLYPRLFWFQMVTHFVSAAAMALLLARFGLDVGLRGRRLVGFVVAFSVVGAVAWEVTEYLGLWKGLNWHGLGDSLLDLGMDALGVALILVLLETRIRPVIDPTVQTPELGDVLRGSAQPSARTDE